MKGISKLEKDQETKRKKQERKNAKELEILLNYAERLTEKCLPIIFSTKKEGKENENKKNNQK